MIKIGIRKNLFYPLMLILLNLIKDTELKFIKHLFSFKKSSLTVSIMFLSEFIAGIIFFKCEKKGFAKSEKEKQSELTGIKLIHSSQQLGPPPDSNLKLFFLLFAAAFFDFFDTILFSFYIPELYEEFSISLTDRLESVLAIITSITCHFLLNFPLYRHQKCSIFIIGICLITIVISEYYILYFHNDEFKKFKMMIGLTRALIFVVIDNFFFSMLFVVEKYLLEYDSLNPFQMLMYEGGFGFIMGFIYLFFKPPFEVLKEVYNKNTDENVINYIILIIGLFIYYIILGIVNSYRVIINKLFSPTNVALIYYMSVPFTIISNIAFYYYSIFKKDEKDKFNYKNYEDFMINGEQNYYYLFFNLFLSIIMIICGFVYNEFFILNCCNLGHDTYHEISLRAKIDDLEIDKSRNSLNEST